MFLPLFSFVNTIRYLHTAKQLFIVVHPCNPRQYWLKEELYESNSIEKN